MPYLAPVDHDDDGGDDDGDIRRLVTSALRTFVVADGAVSATAPTRVYVFKAFFFKLYGRGHVSSTLCFSLSASMVSSFWTRETV